MPNNSYNKVEIHYNLASSNYDIKSYKTRKNRRKEYIIQI